jgi:two-component system, response regulator
MSAKVIFLVEDNPSDIELTRRAFEKSRVANRLVVAEDGKQALDYLFEATNEMPALMLLDLKLPKIPGLEVLKRLRENVRTRRLPVIILTSSNEEQDVARGYDLGVNSYIRKPVDFVQFVQSVQAFGNVLARFE